MNNYLRHVDKMAIQIDKFLKTNKERPIQLFLDGTGILSSYQNTSLAILGPERLEKFKEIHTVSGSSYALFIFLAIQEGEFIWQKEDIKLWNKNVRSWHGIIPGLSLLKFLLFKRLKIQAGKRGGHKIACEQFFSKNFLSRKLSSFPDKYFFWAFNNSTKSLQLINCRNGYSEMTVEEVISACSAVPSVFGSYIYKDHEYVDAMYAKGFSTFKYSVFKNDVLHLNMFKTGTKDNIHSLKIHEHKNGNRLVQNDFMRFLAGLDNNNFEPVTKYALFEAKAFVANISNA